MKINYIQFYYYLIYRYFLNFKQITLLMLSEWILGGTAIPLRGMDPKIEILVLWKFSSKFQLMFQFHLVLYVKQVVSICFL